MSSRMRKLFPAAIAVLVALIIAGYVLRPQTQPLLPRATRITDVNGKYPFYWWLTDEDVLLFRDPTKQDWTFLRRNIKTKVETPLSALTDLFRNTGGNKETLFVSPNGERLLWTSADGNTT